MHYMCEAMERIEARGEARSEVRRQSCALMMIAVIAGAGGAWAATWQGGASGDFNEPANWNGDIATEALVFTQSATATLSANTDVYRVFSAGSNSKGITVVIDLNGHDLGTTAAVDGNRD